MYDWDGYARVDFYDSDGFDREGYNRLGYDREGYDRRGRERCACGGSCSSSAVTLDLGTKPLCAECASYMLPPPTRRGGSPLCPRERRKGLRARKEFNE